ncbi:nickel pincer cofactor biosynthesis protein LarC [Salinibaculum rarum]|uniref:nickel pincer cofactor biosynthesis protein LarC n=1 Tax=Salinibaculum rarum TaxID=3058903 RepID=UPI00265DDFEE|nr:nickel pincer cofactor biosynthesis protein LarC [Salinibaculum sp. KK48]
MRTLAFDGRMGASGDMLLAALLDAGGDRAALSPVEETLAVRYEVGQTVKNGIDATTVDVRLTEQTANEGPGEERDGHDHGGDEDHSHGSGHSHDDSHDHAHDDDHTHDHAEGHGPTRTYGEVVDIVEGMDLPAGVEADALAMFEILGEAEAGVHGTDLTETHFHEVGADDAIADVVGVCLLLADLAVEQVVTTPLATGGGEVEMSHGTYPVPTPAVVEIAERADWQLQGGPVEEELLTPTGAAILAHVADGVERLPAMDIGSSGYGAGTYTFDSQPNVLRAIVGETTGDLARDSITVLETNLDDAPPEVLGGLQETLTDAGARDVSVLPVTMKKSRPGHLVKVVVRPEDAQRVARRLAEETGTLGIREYGSGHRWIADREQVTATIAFEGTEYDVRVKVASADGTVYDVSAEYDDALAVARETGLPVRDIMRRAETLVREE